VILLHAMEYRLLEYLAMRSGQIASKSEILDHLYDFDSENFSNVVEVYISSLRRKLSAGGEDKLIHTVRGQGYMLGEVR
jgi:DNA-binding response OmpR family regulator